MTKQFAVTGMTCAACAAHVERAVSQLPGVQSAAVNLMLGRLNASYDESKVTSDQIIDAVIRAGYGAREADANDLAPTSSRTKWFGGWGGGFCGPPCAWCRCFTSAWGTCWACRCPGFSTKITWLWP